MFTFVRHESHPLWLAEAHKKAKIKRENLMMDVSGSNVMPAEKRCSADHSTTKRLTGRLNSFDIVLATLAYQAPLACTVGFLPLIIGLGNGIGAPLALIAVMLCLLIFARGYVAFTRHVKNPGAFYAYVTAGLGKKAGLGTAFLTLVSYILGGVVVYALGGIQAREFIMTLGGPELPWWSFAIILWVVVTFLTYFHISVSARVLGILLLLEVLAVTIFDVMVFSSGGKSGISAEPFMPSSFFVGNIGLALLFCFNLFQGFEATAIYREETRDPEKNLPRATYSVVLFIGIFYSITTWALISGLGTQEAAQITAADPTNSFINVLKQFGGHWLATLVPLLLLTSVLACQLSLQNVTTRYIYSLGVDGVLPQWLGVTHAKHESPSRASLFSAFIYFMAVAVLTIVGVNPVSMYSICAGICAIGVLASMLLVNFSMLSFFGKNPQANKWTLATAALSSISLMFFLYLGITNIPQLTGLSEASSNMYLVGMLAAVWVAGFAYAHLLRAKGSPVYNRIGRVAT